MRCVAGLGLLALAGCNQIFGIAETRQFDAAIDVPADMPHVVLDWQVAQLLPSGAPDPVIRFAPIDPAPQVRIATLDGGFDSDPTSYSTSDGWIPIPRSYLGATWRLEYRLADGIAHEVQWAPDDKQGHLTVPLFGRVAPARVPQGSGYSITPSGAPGYTYPRLLTTGLWTDAQVTPGAGTTIDFDFYNATPLSGQKGAPDPALGDHALLVDYILDNAGTSATNCLIAVGSAELASAALEAGHLTVQTPPWDGGRKPALGATVLLPTLARFGTALPRLATSLDPNYSRVLLGAAASTDAPGLVDSPMAERLAMALPIPMMATLLRCPYATNPLPPTTKPKLLDSLPRVLNVQLVYPRKVLNATLMSGMETTLVATGTQNGFTMAFPAPLPRAITLTPPGGSAVDLAGDTDQLAIGPATGAFTLAFSLESGTDLRADYYDVVLHKITGGALTTERIYTVTAPTVRVDSAQLSPGDDYVFEIRSYKGHPRAGHGDFAAVDYPYGATIVFTRTFKTS